MGIGLQIWSVSEPRAHFAQPPSGMGGTAGAAERTMRLTFFHWGLHAWVVYAAEGLALACFGYRRGLPLTTRSTLFRLPGAIACHALVTFLVTSSISGLS